MAITLLEQLKYSLSGDQGLGMAWHVRFSVETGVSINLLLLSGTGCGSAGRR